MKKLYLLLIPLFAILITGCGSSGQTLYCEISTNSNGIGLTAKYTIKHDGKYAKSATFYEEYSAADAGTLSQVETVVKNTYNAANTAYGGYTIDVKTSGSKVIANVKIDYDKMDLKKAIESDESVKQFTEDGKMSIEKMKSTYTSAGYTCK
jgi:uncharacterized lipoprotein YehR (DUF1307 family)